MKNYLTVGIGIVLFFSHCHTASAFQQRLMVPDYITCERNSVTSWTGQVVEYQRNTFNIHLKVATDDGTLESTEVSFENMQTMLAHFRLNGEIFNASDWHKIEISTGHLIDGTRITLWLCSDNHIKPIFNWLP